MLLLHYTTLHICASFYFLQLDEMEEDRENLMRKHRLLQMELEDTQQQLADQQSNRKLVRFWTWNISYAVVFLFGIDRLFIVRSYLIDIHWLWNLPWIAQNYRFFSQIVFDHAHEERMIFNLHLKGPNKIIAQITCMVSALAQS